MLSMENLIVYESKWQEEEGEEEEVGLYYFVCKHEIVFS